MILPFRTPAEIDRRDPAVAAHLAAERLLGYPTETVYGLGSAPTRAALAGSRGSRAGQPGKPFLLLVSGRAMAEAWGLVFTASARALSDAFWPGPLTLVLAAARGGCPTSCAGAKAASRCGIRRTGASSGWWRAWDSRSPRPPPTGRRPAGAGPDRLVELFQPAVDAGELLVLDGGVLGNVPPSTLVDCTDSVPRMVREGAIPRAELRRAAGRLAP